MNLNSDELKTAYATVSGIKRGSFFEETQTPATLEQKRHKELA